MALFLGLLYCYMWYVSILAGYVVLYCPALPLLLLSNQLYRRYTDAVITLWQYYPTVLLEWMCRCDISVSGDAIRTGETAILISNHRTRTDWNFLWPCLYHAVSGSQRYRYSSKFILKDSIRHIPGSGWVMQLSFFTYIRRNWTADKEIFSRIVDYVTSVKYKCVTVLFPEGTDFTEKTKRKSDEYANKNGLKTYDKVLHPRTTGFSYLTNALIETNNLDAVYDVTILYPDKIPQTEIEIVKGNFPNEVKFHITRYSKDDLPKDEASLKEFVERLWEDKEQQLKKYESTGDFYSNSAKLKRDSKWEMCLTFLFWSFLPLLAYYLLIAYSSFRKVVVYHTLFLVAFNVFACGFQRLEIAILDLRRRIIGLPG